MKYYQQLANFPTFTLEKAARIMGSSINAPKNLNLMLKEGSIRRIKRNLYTCVNLATGENLASHFSIGSAITDSSFISYHTAFEFYGFYNQVSYEVQVSSAKRFTNFENAGYEYHCYQTNCTLQIDEFADVRVSSVERTIIDSINMLGKVMDVEELVKCLELIHVVDEKRLLEMLQAYDKDILYRKAGYFLSAFKEDFRLSEDFFTYCINHSNPINGGKISSNEILKLTYIPVWGIYGYKNLRNIVTDGEIMDV